MKTALRRCGRTHCPAGERPASCDVAHHVLQAVPSTLLIPLAARAYGGRVFPQWDCGDADAAHVLNCLDVDASPYLADRLTLINILWRTARIKEIGAEFFARHPDGWGACLGCGLSNHFQWLDTGANHWLDADLPEVVALRRDLLPALGPRRLLAEVDLSRPGWWARLGLPTEVPVLLLCEGVLMYLPPHEAHAVLREFADHAAPGSQMVLDTIAECGVGRARLHPSVGPTGAEFRWGLRQWSELTAVHPRLHLLRRHSVAECYGLAGLFTEACWLPWTGAPLYGLAALGV